MRKLYVETTRSEILGARKCFICFECRWQPKLPGTLPDISLPLTVIGGYSDSNGIPTSTSDRSPSLLCTHVYNYTGSATPPPPPPSITCRFVVWQTWETREKMKRKKKNLLFLRIDNHYWSRILFSREGRGSIKFSADFKKLMKFDRRWRGSIV